MCCSQPAHLSWIATHCRFAFFPSPFLFNVEIAKPFLKEVKILQKTFIHWLSPGFGHHVCSDIPFALPSYGAVHFVPSFPEIPLFLFFHGDVNLVLVTLISIHKPIPLLHHLSHVACAISSRLPLFSGLFLLLSCAPCLSFMASKMRGVQSLLTPGSLCSANPAQLPCKAPSHLEGRALRRMGGPEQPPREAGCAGIGPTAALDLLGFEPIATVDWQFLGS